MKSTNRHNKRPLQVEPKKHSTMTRLLKGTVTLTKIPVYSYFLTSSLHSFVVLFSNLSYVEYYNKTGKCQRSFKFFLLHPNRQIEYSRMNAHHIRHTDNYNTHTVNFPSEDLTMDTKNNTPVPPWSS